MTSAFTVPSQRPAARISALALLLVGAALVVVGILQTTTSRLTSVSCPDGTVLVAKFEYKNHGYVFEAPSGNEHIVTISNGDADGGDAHSTIPIKAVVVKGGNDYKIVSYTPAQTDLHFSNDGLSVGHGNKPDISGVQFCRSLTPPPTTTTTTKPPTTTTTSTTTTTTTSSTTTTTEPETTPPTEPETTPPTQPETTPPTQPQTTPPTSPETTASTTTTTTVEQEPVIVTTSTTIVTGSTTSLPDTGAPSAALIALGTVLMVSGGSLMAIGRARDRRANS